MSDRNNPAFAALTEEGLANLLRAVATDRCREFKGNPEDCSEWEAAERITSLTARVAEMREERLLLGEEIAELRKENARLTETKNAVVMEKWAAERERDEALKECERLRAGIT